MFIACDEAGYTGSDLLSKDQRYFAFASVNVTDDEAFYIIRDARDLFPVQMPELKASRLMTSTVGKNLIGHVLERLKGRFAVNAHDKLLALCGWLFEYVFEPVFKDDPKIFYEKDFHRFITMFTYLWINDEKCAASDVIKQFQAYMRTGDISEAPILFDFEDIGDAENIHPFDLVRSFASGYKGEIKSDNAIIKRVSSEEDKWTLDLSASALWSHLIHWGQHDRSLTVLCDESKPLRAIAPRLEQERFQTSDILHVGITSNSKELSWRLKQSIMFEDSRDHPSIQLADIVASSAVYCYSNGRPDDFFQAASLLDSAMIRGSIFPDFDRVKMENPETIVNYAVLYQLAQRAYGRGIDLPVEHYFEIAEKSLKSDV